MNRRERDRYDHDNYDRDYSGNSGYDRNDEHYHSARNLTNDFEQHYRSQHPDRDEDRYSRNRSDMHQRFHENDMGNAYGRMRERRETDRYDSDYNMHHGNRDRGDFGSSRNRSQNWSESDRYGSSGRYSQRSDHDDYNRQDRDMRNRDRFSNQERSSSMEQGRDRRMSQDRMREGYGISDYGRTSQSNIRSNRGVPNAGLTNSFDDDYGVDLDSNRSNRISSGSYGGFGTQGGSHNRDDRY